MPFAALAAGQNERMNERVCAVKFVFRIECMRPERPLGGDGFAIDRLPKTNNIVAGGSLREVHLLLRACYKRGTKSPRLDMRFEIHYDGPLSS